MPVSTSTPATSYLGRGDAARVSERTAHREKWVQPLQAAHGPRGPWTHLAGQRQGLENQMGAACNMEQGLSSAPGESSYYASGSYFGREEQWQRGVRKREVAVSAAVGRPPEAGGAELELPFTPCIVIVLGVEPEFVSRGFDIADQLFQQYGLARAGRPDQ